MSAAAPRLRAAATTIVLAVVVFGGAFAIAAERARADDSNGGSGGQTITVQVNDGSTSTPTPAGTGTGTGKGTGGGGTGTNINNGGNGTNINNGNSGPGASNGGGMIYMGGLVWHATPTANPGGGTILLDFDTRSAATSTFDATVTFWITNPFGVRLDQTTVRLDGFAPGTTRHVSAELHGGGQWTVLGGHATLTPPAVLDGIKLQPIQRDAVVWLVPWLLLTILMVAAIIAAIIAMLRASSRVARFRVSG